jgi:hypothetical protein
MSKTVLGLLLCVALGCIVPAVADDGPTPPLSVSQHFSSRGTVRMYLTSGSYSIRSTDAEQIHVTGTADYPSDQSRLRAEVNIRGTEATVVTRGPHNNTHFTIEVPRHSNLLIRLSAGDIEVQRVEGDLDISSHAGDVDVEVPRASDYRSVDASVLAGDLNAPAFGTSTGGLFRSLHWSGSGAYRLHAHLGAGDLELHAAE